MTNSKKIATTATKKSSYAAAPFAPHRATEWEEKDGIKFDADVCAQLGFEICSTDAGFILVPRADDLHIETLRNFAEETLGLDDLFMEEFITRSLATLNKQAVMRIIDRK